MSNDNSITHYLRQLANGDEDAAQRLWERYFERLVSVARKRLGEAPRRVVDEEDVALSVFRCLCSGAVRGRFSEVANRDELWRLLVTMAAHKVIDHRRAAMGQKRGSGQVRGDSVFNDNGLTGAGEGFDELVGEAPTPEFLALLADEHQRLMQLLDDDTLRQIALWKMEGYKNGEIAAQLNLTRRSVERKLQWIRQLWNEEVELLNS